MEKFEKYKIKFIALGASAILILVDLWSKSSIEQLIPLEQSRVVINNFFWLTNVRNTGAAFSWFNTSTSTLTIISIVASTILVRYFVPKEMSKISTVAFSLMIAGTIGNAIDRMLFGYVRDFLSFSLFGYMFPVFNLADTFLVIGAFLFSLDVVLQEKRRRAKDSR